MDVLCVHKPGYLTLVTICIIYHTRQNFRVGKTFVFGEEHGHLWEILCGSMLVYLYFQLTQSYIHWKIVVEWTTMKTANIFLLKSALYVSTPVTMRQHILTTDVTVHAIVTTLVEYL